MEDEDIEAVLMTAKNIRKLYRHGFLNPLSSLPEAKIKLKTSIKERIRHLAGVYTSLAVYVDDDDLLYAEKYPKSKKTKKIYLKVIEDIETAQNEMRRFKIMEDSSSQNLEF